jgi:extradiol dioxygenase family protein
MDAVLHLSIPVQDLVEARAFYLDVLGCRPGRVRDGWLDVWFHDMQVTLHERPEEVLADPGVRHFGVTLGAAELADLLDRMAAHPVRWLHPVTTDFAGTSREQTKAKVLDPSGNVIELKSYADPAAAFDD